jgi:molybdopterin molybdotransferase
MREQLSVEEYIDELLGLVAVDERSDSVAVADSLGRVLAQEVVSTASIPVFDNSAMDGYAVRWSDIATVPTRLRIVGDVPAGSDADPDAAPGECVRIMTGAPLPTFADTVVPVEQTQDEGPEVVVLEAPDRKGAHVRRAGEDVGRGAVVAHAGMTITPGVAGAVAAVGVEQVAVRPRPRVSVCVTGDELVRGGNLRRGQIYESNSAAVGSLLEHLGADLVRTGLVRDRPQQLVDWLDRAALDSDLVVLTGGASVGAYDVVRDVVTAAGGVFRHVRIQPGKPQGWGVWKGTPVVCLPGNPVSAVVSTEIFIRPMLDLILGRGAAAWHTAVAGSDWISPNGRRQVLPVTLGTDDAGRLIAVPAHSGGSGSHLVTSLAAADGYAIVAEATTAVHVGDLLSVRWL